MKKLFLALTIVSSLISCTQNNSETKNTFSDKIESKPELFIETLTVSEINGKEERKEVISQISDEYFEIILGKQGDHYIATKDIENPTSVQNFKMEEVSVVEKQGELLHFKGTTEFLNYMYERGYEMADQIPSKYGADYTFKKK